MEAKREKSGGAYCEVCKTCINPPRARKHYMPDWWAICEKCEPDMIRITFVPRENAVKTDFNVSYKDIPKLIDMLERAYNCKLNDSLFQKDL